MKREHAIVLGGSSGIGLACVERYLKSGWHVTSISRSKGPLESEDLFHFEADATIETELDEAFKASRQRFGRPTAIVHSIGDIPDGESIQNITVDRFTQSFSLNLVTLFNSMRLSFNDLCAAGDAGSFTFVSSIASSKPYPGIADYCSMKAAAANLIKSYALELAPRKARANCVSPAVVRTRLFENAPFSEIEAESWHKLSRIGEPDEIASVVLFLSSHDAKWITGADYLVDGGMAL